MLVHTVAKKVIVSAQSCGPCGDSIAAIGVRWFAACMQPKQWNWTQMKLNLQLNSMLFEQSHLIWSQKRSSTASYAASWLMEIRITGEESSSLASIYLAGRQRKPFESNALIMFSPWPVLTLVLLIQFQINSKSSGSSQEAHKEHQVQEGHKDPHQGPLLQTQDFVS